MQQKTPIVIVHGMGGAPLYKEKDGALTEAGSLRFRDIAATLRQHPSIPKSIIKLAGTEPLEETEWNEMLDWFSALASLTDVNCAEDGSAGNVKVLNDWCDPLSLHPEYFDYDNGVTRLAKALCLSYGEENVYPYNYDWRLDLYESGANGLNRFIRKVLEKAGADKVILVCDSLGGATVNCYLDAHRSDHVLERLVIVNGAMQGVDLASAYTKDLYITKEDAASYLKNLSFSLDGGKYEPLFFLGSILFNRLTRSLSDQLNSGFETEDVQDRLFADGFKQIFGNMPALYECIPYDHFDVCMEQMIRLGYLKQDSPLHKTVQRYHEVQHHAVRNITDLRKSGIPVAVFASYGYPGIPVTKNCRKQTDILIETEYESYGATVARAGETLDLEPGMYHSGDLEIDASTAALPDSTWFFKYLRHVDFKVGTPAMEFIVKITTGEYPCNIGEVAAFTGLGQFLEADDEQNIRTVTAPADLRSPLQRLQDNLTDFLPFPGRS